MIRLSHYVM